MAFEIKLAICDDELIYRESTEAACKAFFGEKSKVSCATDAVINSSVDGSADISMDISIFSSGKELIASDKDFDILFLDIEMPDLDGISVKDYFITHRKQTRIIFMTSHQERAIEAFGKNVVRFLVKPLKRKEFWRVLEETLLDICGEVLEIEENGTSFCLPVKQIQYIEAQDKYTTAVTLTGDYLVRKTMKFWEKELPEQDFCRIHKSYLVNLEYLDKKGNEVILGNGKRVKISRLKKAEITEKYKAFLRRKVREL